MKEDVDGGSALEEPAQYVKGLDKGPAVEVQLGWGDIDLR